MASLDHEDDDAIRLEPAESSLVSTVARRPVGFGHPGAAEKFVDGLIVAND